jgi:hypothetical protein
MGSYGASNPVYITPDAKTMIAMELATRAGHS